MEYSAKPDIPGLPIIFCYAAEQGQPYEHSAYTHALYSFLMLHEPLEKIVAHEGNKSSGHRIQKIDIYDSFVGDLKTSYVVSQRNLKTRKAA